MKSLSPDLSCREVVCSSFSEPSSSKLELSLNKKRKLFSTTMLAKNDYMQYNTYIHTYIQYIHQYLDIQYVHAYIHTNIKYIHTYIHTVYTFQ